MGKVVSIATARAKRAGIQTATINPAIDAVLAVMGTLTPIEQRALWHLGTAIADEELNPDLHPYPLGRGLLDLLNSEPRREDLRGWLRGFILGHADSQY